MTLFFTPGGLEHVGKPHAGPSGAGNGAVGPLVALGRRVEKAASVAAAFDLQRRRHHLEFLLQLIDGERHGLVDQTVDGELPALGIEAIGRDPVIADEMVLGRRDRVVQEMGQRLRVHGPVVEDPQTVLAFDLVFSGQRDGNEVGGILR